MQQIASIEKTVVGCCWLCLKWLLPRCNLWRSVTVNPAWPIKRPRHQHGSETQRCSEEEEAGRRRRRRPPARRLQSPDQTRSWASVARLWKRRGKKGRGTFLAERRRSNGVFQFAVAGNERSLKRGQPFWPSGGGGGGRGEKQRTRCCVGMDS